MPLSSPIDLRAIARTAMAQYGFNPQFPKAAIREVEGFAEEIPPGKQKQEIRDLRSLLWSSIDNDDSQDLDQIEYCERQANGEIHVKVAIADVDGRVAQGEDVDQYAHHNGTSVYTGIEIYGTQSECQLPDQGFRSRRGLTARKWHSAETNQIRKRVRSI